MLFESALYARVARRYSRERRARGARRRRARPRKSRRLAQPGRRRVVVIGADGKSGILACAQAESASGRGPRDRRRADAARRRRALAARTPARRQLHRGRRARRAGDLATRSPTLLPALADLTINCVNVPGTELASILCATRRRHRLLLFDEHVVHGGGARRRRRRQRRHDDHRQRLREGPRATSRCRRCATIPPVLDYFTNGTPRAESWKRTSSTDGQPIAKLAPASSRPSTEAAFEHRNLRARRILARDPGVRGDRRGDVPRPHLAGAQLGQERRRTPRDDHGSRRASISSPTCATGSSARRWRCGSRPT